MRAFNLSRNLASLTPSGVTKTASHSSAVPSDSQPSVTEKVMAGIRSLLIKSELAPGSRIDQIELTRRFGVSIVPIREALARLASVGLVEIIAHRGVFVAKVSAEELVDLYTLRELLEEQAARIAVSELTDDDLTSLERVAGEMAAAARSKEFDRFLVLNRELHFTLYRATKRRHMLQMIEQLWDLSARYAHLQLHAVPERAAQSIAEIRTIVSACRRRDRDEVGLMVRYKVHQTSVALLERMQLLEQRPELAGVVSLKAPKQARLPRKKPKRIGKKAGRGG
jgi:DNA-binding GntR family transcriptional regulator